MTNDLLHEKNIMHSKSYSNYQDKSLEAEASDTLGGVYQLMADNETALQVCADSLYIMIQYDFYPSFK